MKTIKKHIFGNDVVFTLKNQQNFDILSEELQHYANSQNGEINQIEIRDHFREKITVVTKNPSSFIQFERGFQTSTRLIQYRVFFTNYNVTLIEFEILEKPGSLSILRKCNDIQFTNRRERIGQILHESILIPLLFFQSDRLLIHASGIQNASDEVTLFGGTGGVGKTSIELLACYKGDNNFICDDIAVLNGKQVYANLNYPKIYAYNVEGNKSLKNEILKKQSLMNKLFWNIKLIQGQNKVRRRVDPIQFFKSKKVDEDLSKIKNYIILRRVNTNQLEIKPLLLDEASKMSLSIIKTEFGDFFRTLEFFKLNASYSNTQLSESIHSIQDNYIAQFKRSFETIAIHALDIPIHLNHQDFLDQAEKILSKEGII